MGVAIGSLTINSDANLVSQWPFDGNSTDTIGILVLTAGSAYAGYVVGQNE